MGFLQEHPRLDAHALKWPDVVRLSVMDALDKEDYLFAALVCRGFRDALCSQHKRSRINSIWQPRFKTTPGAVACSPARLDWARALGRDGPRWLQARSTQLLRAIYQGGSVESLEHVHNTLDAFTMHRCCELAAAGGHLAMLQWARAQPRRTYWDANTCANAAKGGHLHVLQWARSRTPPCPWNAFTCCDAASGGHLAVLQWARGEGCIWDGRTMALAAAGGHLQVLKWSRGEGCDWDSSTCALAAEGGHLEVLQWARSEGCDWNSSTCTCAARGGHLEVLQWARGARGAPHPAAMGSQPRLQLGGTWHV